MLRREDLRLSECCGICEHTTPPKTIETHAPHYNVAKTERWCHLHNCKTIREAICKDFKMTRKGTRKSSMTRVINYNISKGLFEE